MAKRYLLVPLRARKTHLLAEAVEPRRSDRLPLWTASFLTATWVGRRAVVDGFAAACAEVRVGGFRCLKDPRQLVTNAAENAVFYRLRQSPAFSAVL